MKEIRVPKPPANAFNPDRPASDLLKQQVRHLEWAVRHAGERRADFHKVKYVKTEREAAKRMQQLLPRLASASQLSFATIPIQEEAPASQKPKPRRKTNKRKTTTKTKSKRKKTKR
ncbi:MAG TPA: hypothetical protein VNR64_07520 [Vicinamibacterales bacterium]|nr:hypothetical protein [Vicinamibacterales bacterium]